MKKILCIIISLFLTIASSMTAAHAWSEKNDVNYWKAQLKQWHKHKDKRKQFIKEIVNLKRQQGMGINVNLIFLNGEELYTDVPPVLKYGRALLPVRAITAALGADVKWNPATRTAVITKDGVTIEIKLGSEIVKVNGKEYTLDVPAESVNGRIVVPVRFIAETFNQKVEWDEETGSIIIESAGEEEDENDENGNKYEAEKALLSGGAKVNNNYSGYSGTGYVDGYWNKGAKTTFTVKVSSSGYYDVKLRYSNGKGSTKTLSIFVNGSKVKQTSLPDTGGWSKWDYKTERLELASGNNTITYKYDNEDSGNVNLDCIVFERAASSNNGTLTVDVSVPAYSVNLSAEGTKDWVHWGFGGDTKVDRKSGVTRQISDFTKIGNEDVKWYADNPVGFSWTGGTPASSATDTQTGVYVKKEGNGFSITVPADTNQKTLKLYIGAWKAKGKLTAGLSDGSASSYTGYVDSPSGTTCKVFAVSFKTASGGETLTVRYVLEHAYDENYGNITLQAATLQ